MTKLTAPSTTRSSLRQCDGKATWVYQSDPDDDDAGYKRKMHAGMTATFALLDDDKTAFADDRTRTGAARTRGLSLSDVRLAGEVGGRRRLAQLVGLVDEEYLGRTDEETNAHNLKWIF